MGFCSKYDKSAIMVMRYLFSLLCNHFSSDVMKALAIYFLVNAVNFMHTKYCFIFTISIYILSMAELV